MRSWHWYRVGLAALGVMALCALAAGSALAEDDGQAESSAEKKAQATVIVTKDGTVASDVSLLCRLTVNAPETDPVRVTDP